MPVMIAGVVLFIAGLIAVKPTKEAEDFQGALDSIAGYLAANNLPEAQQRLDALQLLIPQATTGEQAWFEQLWGDLVYQQMSGAGKKDAASLNLMLGYYRRAQDIGRTLDDPRLQRMAEALVAMQRDDEAVEVLKKMHDAPADRRYQVTRGMIERRLVEAATTPGGDRVQVQKLIDRYLTEVAGEKDKAQRRAAEIWGYATRARIMLDSGDAKGTIELVEPRMIALMDQGGDKDLGPLQVLRARAYLQKGDFKVAADAFANAAGKLPQGDPLHAEVLVGLAQISLVQTDDLRAALAHFKQAEDLYRPTSGDLTRSAYMDALLGRADCEARLARHVEAQGHLEQAVKVFNETKNPDPVRKERLVQIALSHHLAVSDLQQYDNALNYLWVLQPLFGENMAPPMYLMLAVTHERIAKKKLRDAGLPVPSELPSLGGGAVEAGTPADAEVGSAASAGEKPVPAPQPGAEALKMTRADAARHFEKAGKHYIDHAERVKAIDPQLAGDSWWAAAAAYDNAFQWQLAVNTYQKFLDNRGDDPRRIDAVFRLGLAYLADKRYKQAVEHFQLLRQMHPNHKMTAASMVPLARAHMAQDQNDAAARVLLEVVTDHPSITPDSVEYRDALILLGKLHHQLSQFEPAIQRLAVAVDKYGQSDDGPMLRFLLAESYRQSIAAIDKSLLEPLPQTKVNEYRNERTRRLEQAMNLFGQVVTQLAEADEKKLPPLMQLYFRNAYFYRADCAFDLGRYEQAIELYDAAARRWRDHPASLVALVQMVNAYSELGQIQNARAVNLRARDHLRRMPENAFDDPSLPMSRKHWQDWLRWSGKLNLFDQQATAEK